MTKKGFSGEWLIFETLLNYRTFRTKEQIQWIEYLRSNNALNNGGYGSFLSPSR